VNAESSADVLFTNGCRIIEDIWNDSESRGLSIPSEIVAGYELLRDAHISGHPDAGKTAIAYFVEGAFPVFSESSTFEITRILAEMGFDEAMFLCGHYLEFGMDGNPPSDPCASLPFYKDAFSHGFESATVSLARRHLIQGEPQKAMELYVLAVKNDYRERREAVLTIGYMQFYGIASAASPSDAHSTWEPMGDTFLTIAEDYCRSHPCNPDLMEFLRRCKVNFEIGFI